MLKNRAMGGEPIPSGDDRPRKKLSFRDPEVVSPPRSGYPPQSPSVRNSSQQHHISRPHSIAGVIGLGGFSAQGGVPGLPTSQISSRSSSLTRSISTTQAPASPSLPSKTSIHSSQASSQNTSRTLTRQSAHEGQTTQAKSNNPEPLKPYVHNQTSQQQVKQQQSPKKLEMNNRSQQKNHQSSQRQPVRCFRRSLSHLDESLVYNGRNSDPVSSLSLEDLELENQAMRVVRTIGQAFEVCHKMAIKDKSPSPDFHADDISREGSEDSSDKPRKDRQDSESGQEDLITLPSDTYNDEQIENLPTRPSKLEPLASPKGSDILKKGETFASPLSELLSSGDYLTQAGTPLSVHHELQLLREQLEQQQQQTQAAVAQVHLLRDQLAAETAARLEAQARTHQLLVHNKDLLEHIQQLVLQVRDLEIKLHGGSGVSGSIQMPPIPPDVKSEQTSTSGAPWLTLHQRQLSQQLSTSLPDTPPTPSPTLGAQTFRFPSFHSTSPLAYSHPSSPLISPLFMTSGDIILPVPHQESQLQRQQQYLQEQQQRLQQQLRQRDLPPHLQQRISMQNLARVDDGSCSTLSSGDGDHKKEACGQSSSESLASAMSQLYNTDHKRLPQVPEDSVPLPNFGNTLLVGAEGLAPRGVPFNGPITRAASERYSRQETLAQMQRMAWARHTTK